MLSSTSCVDSNLFLLEIDKLQDLCVDGRTATVVCECVNWIHVATVSFSRVGLHVSVGKPTCFRVLPFCLRLSLRCALPCPALT